MYAYRTADLPRLYVLPLTLPAEIVRCYVGMTFEEIGLPLTISELGATEDMIDNIVSTTNIFPAGYMDLKPEDIKSILKESL